MAFSSDFRAHHGPSRPQVRLPTPLRPLSDRLWTSVASRTSGTGRSRPTGSPGALVTLGAPVGKGRVRGGRVTAAPTLPYLHSGGARAEEHRLRNSTGLPMTPRFKPAGHSAERSPTVRIRAGPDPTPQGQRRRAVQGAQCRGTRRGSTCLLRGPRSRPERHSAETPPTGRVHAGADPTLQKQRRRTARETQCRGTAYVS